MYGPSPERKSAGLFICIYYIIRNQLFRRSCRSYNSIIIMIMIIIIRLYSDGVGAVEWDKIFLFFLDALFTSCT